jgi:hypothetical protein
MSPYRCRRCPPFWRLRRATVRRMIPGCRPVPFGHIGDGNIHFNISQPVGAGKEAFLAHWEDVAREVHAIVRAMGGSISAEHGIGTLEARRVGRHQAAGRAGDDARGQAHARPQRHHEPRQGAVSHGQHRTPPGAGRGSRRRDRAVAGVRPGAGLERPAKRTSRLPAQARRRTCWWRWTVDTVIASVMVGHDGHRGIVYYVATHPDYRRKGPWQGHHAGRGTLG